jgi:hypothetical protein
MKSILFIIGLLISSTLFGKINTDISKQFVTIDDTLEAYITNLQIGDSVSYKTYLTSCISGDRHETMDSVCFYRDSLNLKAIYKNTLYTIDPNNLWKLRIIESKILALNMTTSTSYYNYIITYQETQILLGYGNKDSWEEIIQFIKNP